MTITLSALVVAHNEQKHLPDCLETLTFADQIVVVLDKCTDDSKSIAAHYTDQLIEGAWDIEGVRRNIGIEGCTSEWVLEIDADERVSKELADEIRKVIIQAEEDYYYIPFDNYIGKRLVKHGWGCYWGVSSAPRLFKKGYKVWGDATVHPSYDIKGQSGRLQHAIRHYVDDNISDMIRRFDRYTNARAKDMVQQGISEGIWRNIRRVFSRFLKCFIMHKGYKEGGYGFLNAIFAGLYPLVSYLKAREIHDE